jgi:hypothetical protein
MQAIQAIYVSWAAGGRSLLCAIPAPLMLAGVARRAAMSNRISGNIRRGTIAPAVIV